jgi:hypothetical protein
MENNFKQFWKAQAEQVFEKKLTLKELGKIRETITNMHKRGVISSKIISKLTRVSPKISTQWEASRAYWTESKRMDTQKVGEIGDDIGITKYRVILSPDACEVCRKKTDNGAKIIKSEDVHKSGYGHVPPYHPGCFCILVPRAD